MKRNKRLAILMTFVFMLTLFSPMAVGAAKATSIHLKGAVDGTEIAYVGLAIFDDQGNFIELVTDFAGQHSDEGLFLMSKQGQGFTIGDDATDNLPMITAFIVNGDTYIVNPLSLRDPRIKVGQEGNLGAGTNNYWILEGSVSPEIQIVKTADNGPGPYLPGDIVDYSFVVTNLGADDASALYNVYVEDSTIGYETAEDDYVELAPGESYTFSASFEIPEDYIETSFENTAIAYGTYGLPDVFETTISDEDSEVIVITQFTDNPSISITKIADISVGEVGDTITYTIVVTNSGDVDLYQVDVNDDNLDIYAYIGYLASGSSITLTQSAIHVITYDDLIIGSYTNIVTAAGMYDDSGRVVSAQAIEVVQVVGTPGIEVTKVSNRMYAEVGDVITYTIEVTNIGNVELTDVTVVDLLVGLDVNLGSITSGASILITPSATYTVTVNDGLVGKVINVVGVTGDYGVQEVVDSDHEEVIIHSPSILVEKTIVDEKDAYEVGESIIYSIIVTNNGNVELTGVNVVDDLVGINQSLPDLAIGESVTVTAPAIHVVNYSDLMVGTFTNTVTAGGMSAQSERYVDDTDTEIANITGSPSIDIIKTSDISTGKVGDMVTYTIEITNTGNVTLTDVVIVDALLGLDIQVGTLLSGASYTVTPAATYILTLDDLAEGFFENIATTEGTYNDAKVEDDDNAIVVADGTPLIRVYKDANITSGTVGDVITYTIIVENVGNVPLVDVMVVDDILGESFGPITLDVGEEVTISPSFTYTVTIDDVYEGSFNNIVTASGLYINEEEEEIEVTDNDEASVETYAEPEITVVKTVDQSSVIVGTTVNYTIIVTNTGNIDLHHVRISDPMFGGNLDEVIELLAVGESYTVTDPLAFTTLVVGSVENTATATGWIYIDDEVMVEDSDTATVSAYIIPPPPPNYNPSISVGITPDNTLVLLGTDVTFTMVVTNMGNTILNNVRLINVELGFDELLTAPLFIGQSKTFMVTKTMNELLTFTTFVNAEGISPQYVTVLDDSNTLVDVYEEEEEIPEEDIPEANPETGVIPFDLYGILSLLTLGAGVILIKKRKENEE